MSKGEQKPRPVFDRTPLFPIYEARLLSGKGSDVGDHIIDIFDIFVARSLIVCWHWGYPLFAGFLWARIAVFVQGQADGDAELPTNPPWKGLISPARLANPLVNPPPSHLRADDRLLRSPLSGDSLATTKVARAVSS
jgi:hypothetical protein